jgi:hypothetical protein
VPSLNSTTQGGPACRPAPRPQDDDDAGPSTISDRIVWRALNNILIIIAAAMLVSGQIQRQTRELKAAARSDDLLSEPLHILAIV